MLEWKETDGAQWRATVEGENLVVDCAAGHAAGWHSPPMPVAGVALYRQLVKVTGQLVEALETGEKRPDWLAARVGMLETEADEMRGRITALEKP